MTDVAPQAATTKPKPTASALCTMLRERYPSASHVTLEEVRDAAGFEATRSCDVMSLGTWPSRGLLLRGFEIKVSRSDWLREYREPAKAETFAAYCDEWYIVAADSKIVQPDELPATWGLLVARGSRLECVQPATRNAKPDPIDRGLLVALLKRATEQGPTQAALESARENGVKQGRGLAEREFRGQSNAADVEALRTQTADLERRIRDFERAAGLHMSDFRYGDPTALGDAVRAVLHGQTNPLKHRADHMIRDLENVMTSLKRLRDLPDLRLESAGSSPAQRDPR